MPVKERYRKNPEKACAETKSYYARNRESSLARSSKWYRENVELAHSLSRKHRQKRRMLIDGLKDAPCVDCGIKYPPYVMDFDHVRGEKLMTVGHLKGTKKRLLAEVAKCELVCSNCHRERTHQKVWKLQNKKATS